jgi:hypothetical protein
MKIGFDAEIEVSQTQVAILLFLLYFLSIVLFFLFVHRELLDQRSFLPPFGRNMSSKNIPKTLLTLACHLEMIKVIRDHLKSIGLTHDEAKPHKETHGVDHMKCNCFIPSFSHFLIFSFQSDSYLHLADDWVIWMTTTSTF